MPGPDHEAQEVIEISSDSESDSSEDALNAPLRALNYASRSHLHNAIATLPEARVRQAFSALIDTLPSMSERVFQMLLAEQRLPIIQRGSQAELDEQDASDDDEEEGAAEVYPHQKILIPRWAVCANCGDDFDVGQERQDGECKYHSGEYFWTDCVHPQSMYPSFPRRPRGERRSIRRLGRRLPWAHGHFRES